MSDVTVILRPVANIASATKDLSQQERQRAESMGAARRDEFIAGRVLLRRQLAHWDKPRSPGAVPLTSQPGKAPRYTGAAHVPYFSLSHCRQPGGSWVALALSTSAPVGVDIEVPTRRIDIARLAMRRFHPDDTRYVMAGKNQRAERFFRLWTLKEALVKLAGGQLLSVLRETAFRLDDSGQDGSARLTHRPPELDGPLHFHSIILPRNGLALSLALGLASRAPITALSLDTPAELG